MTAKAKHQPGSCRDQEGAAARLRGPAPGSEAGLSFFQPLAHLYSGVLTLEAVLSPLCLRTQGAQIRPR